MYKKVMMSMLSIAILTACTNTRENAEDNNGKVDTQPINYETEGERKDRLNIPDNQKQEEHPKQEKQNYSDAFTNEESVMISKTLEKRKDITQAQVASTDDRIIVAVVLSNQPKHDIVNKIETDIKEIVPNKQIVIYTDESHWERMKNLDSGLRSKGVGPDMEDRINYFFHTDN